MHATFLTLHHMHVQTSQLDVAPLHLYYWMCFLMRPTMELTGGIQRQARQRHVKLGVIVELTLEMTLSLRERLAVDPWGFLFQVRLCSHLGGTWPGVITLKRRLSSQPILSMVQMSIPNSLVPVMMARLLLTKSK